MKSMTETDRSVFENSAEKADSAAHYQSYPAGIPNQFIREYGNGRKILIEIDPETGKEHFLKDL